MKKQINKLFAFLLAAAVTLSSYGCGVASENSDTLQAGEVNLSFVAINDIHGTIEQNADGLYGLSNTAEVIDSFSANYGKNDRLRDDVILFGNGDMFQGTAISNMSKGQAVIDAMNEMGFDGMGLGNHEFDWGLDVITAYFDGDASNGEANFPLIAANVYKKSASGYVADVSEDDNVVNGVVVNKSGVKVGLIGVIGPCENSILASRVEDYSFTHEYIAERVKTVATELKSEGAQIISLNVHYSEYYNNDFANIKNGDDYLIDVIFNGHSHQKYKTSETRGDGYTVPVVQGGSNNGAISYVKLTYNTENATFKVKDYGYRNITGNDKAFDKNVEYTIRNYKTRLIDSLPVLAVSGVTVRSGRDLAGYTGAVMTSAFGTDYAVSNYGGLRSNGNIVKGKKIKEDAFYKIIPFDNVVYVMEMQGTGLYRLFNEQSDYDYFGTKSGAKTLSTLEADESYYTVAIIDYVYTGNYFDPYRQYVRNDVSTTITLRDVLVADAALHGKNNIEWSYFGSPLIGRIYE